MEEQIEQVFMISGVLKITPRMVSVTPQDVLEAVSTLLTNGGCVEVVALQASELNMKINILPTEKQDWCYDCDLPEAGCPCG